MILLRAQVGRECATGLLRNTLGQVQVGNNTGTAMQRKRLTEAQWRSLHFFDKGIQGAYQSCLRQMFGQ
jgi:hypothetical protein